MAKFSDIKQKVVVEIDGGYEGSEEIRFLLSTGETYVLYHSQDCCESVSVEEIIGDMGDLVGSPILMAEEVSNHGSDWHGSQTWTFYKLATINGYVTIRWMGSSNGYYSESVDFRIEKSS